MRRLCANSITLSRQCAPFDTRPSIRPEQKQGEPRIYYISGKDKNKKAKVQNAKNKGYKKPPYRNGVSSEADSDPDIMRTSCHLKGTEGSPRFAGNE